MAKKTFDGVIVYEILPNGCLNGVYSNDNTKTKNEIYNEIARKKDNNKDSSNDSIYGKYVCTYIDVGNVANTCDLEIKHSPTKKRGQYHFLWTRNSKPIFEGSGWRTRQNQITVSYRDII